MSLTLSLPAYAEASAGQYTQVGPRSLGEGGSKGEADLPDQTR
jgi:hypothetical protein